MRLNGSTALSLCRRAGRPPLGDLPPGHFCSFPWLQRACMIVPRAGAFLFANHVVVDASPPQLTSEPCPRTRARQSWNLWPIVPGYGCAENIRRQQQQSNLAAESQPNASVSVGSSPQRIQRGGTIQLGTAHRHPYSGDARHAFPPPDQAADHSTPHSPENR
jgi:hypothetical protein